MNLENLQIVIILIFTLASGAQADLFYTSLSNTDCAGCSGGGAGSAPAVLTPGQFAVKRRKFEHNKIEAEKKKILAGLGLKSPPNFPEPQVFPNQDSSTQNAIPVAVPEFFLERASADLAKKQQPVVELESDKVRKLFVLATEHTGTACPSSCLCYHFELGKDFKQRSVENATLWIHGSNLNSDGEPAIALSITDANIPLNSIDTDIVGGNDWRPLQVTELVSQWATKKKMMNLRTMQLCSTPPLTLYTSEQQRPFIEVSTSPLPSRSRRRLTDNFDEVRPACFPDVYNQCCVERFYVNFTEIGWSRWVIAPEGYWSNYCTGNCMLSADTPHTALMGQLATVKIASGEPYDDRMLPCCAPRGKLDSLKVVYMLEPDKLKTVFIENMIVKECGC